MIAIGVKGDQCQVQAKTPETNAQLGIGPEVCDAVVARSQPADRGRLTEVIPADELKRRVARERLLEIDQPSDPRPSVNTWLADRSPCNRRCGTDAKRSS